MGQDGEMHDAGSTCPSECEEEEAHRGDERVVCASTGKRTGEDKRISTVRAVGSALTGRDEAEAAGGNLVDALVGQAERKKNKGERKHAGSSRA